VAGPLGGVAGADHLGRQGGEGRHLDRRGGVQHGAEGLVEHGISPEQGMTPSPAGVA